MLELLLFQVGERCGRIADNRGFRGRLVQFLSQLLLFLGGGHVIACSCSMRRDLAAAAATSSSAARWYCSAHVSVRGLVHHGRLGLFAAGFNLRRQFDRAASSVARRLARATRDTDGTGRSTAKTKSRAEPSRPKSGRSRKGAEICKRT